MSGVWQMPCVQDWPFAQGFSQPPQWDVSVWRSTQRVWQVWRGLGHTQRCSWQRLGAGQVLGVQVSAGSHADDSDKSNNKPQNRQESQADREGSGKTGVRENQVDREEQGKTGIAGRSCEDESFVDPSSIALASGFLEGRKKDRSMRRAIGKDLVSVLCGFSEIGEVERKQSKGSRFFVEQAVKDEIVFERRDRASAIDETSLGLEDLEGGSKHGVLALCKLFGARRCPIVEQLGLLEQVAL